MEKRQYQRCIDNVARNSLRSVRFRKCYRPQRSRKITHFLLGRTSVFNISQIFLSVDKTGQEWNRQQYVQLIIIKIAF